MFSLALIALGSTVTLAPYSNAVDYRLSIARPGLGSSSDGIEPDLRDFGWRAEHAARHGRVEELLRAAASGGVACPASLTTDDVQAYFAWRSSLDAYGRAKADTTLVLLRQSELDAQEEAERAEAQAEGATVTVPEIQYDADAAPYMEIVYRS